MLKAVLTAELFTTFMVFARIGSAFIMLPTIGETFLSPRARLGLAVVMSIVVAPVVAPIIPAIPPDLLPMLGLIGIEILVGIFIGTAARVLMGALAVAGTVIAFLSGLASALLFNPLLSDQGALQSVFLTLLGLLLLFATDMHHLLIRATVESYAMFEPGVVPMIGDMADTIGRVTADSFALGLQISAPIIVVAVMFYVLLGLLARLMPQMQVFFVAMPLQILVGTFVMMISLSGMMIWFVRQYAELVANFLPL